MGLGEILVVEDANRPRVPVPRYFVALCSTFVEEPRIGSHVRYSIRHQLRADN